MTVLNRLRSPRGSPRNSANAPLSHSLWYMTLRFLRYTLLGLIPLALLWTTKIRPLDVTTQIESISPQVDVSPSPYTATLKTDPGQDDNNKKSNTRNSHDILFSYRSDGEDIDNQSIRSYMPSLYPILNIADYSQGNSTDEGSSKRKFVQVHYIVDVSHNTGPQSKFILDGLERSKYLRVVKITFARNVIKTINVNPVDPNQPVLFIVDWGSMNRDCHILDRVLHQEKQSLAQEQQLLDTKTQVVLLDFSGSTRQSTCRDMDDVRIRLVKRNIVQNRHYDGHTINPGELVPNHGLEVSDGPVVQAPIVVREIFVKGVVQTSSIPAYKSERPVDISMFWNKGHNTHYGFWRRDVSVAVEALNQTLAGSLKRIHAQVHVAENEDTDMEFGYVQLEYVRQLLSTKIVVVAQRDEWEDHYRLMESLASGALVLTDRMLTLPPSIQNKTHLLVYDDIPMLERLVRFYLNPKNEEKRLAIAKNGWKVVMGRHRAWHRVEEILFGKPQTRVGRAYDPPPPKQDRAIDVEVLSEEPFVVATL